MFVSYVYLLAAVALCAYVGKFCFPAYFQTLRDTVAGSENNVLAEAFTVFSDELKDGSSLKHAFTTSVEVFAYGSDPD